MTYPHPPIRPFGAARVPAMTGDESSAFDGWAIREVGVPQPVLMENAGRSAAQLLERLFPRGPVVGFVGAGNNGGDALVALRTLAAWGRPVHAILVADRDEAEALLHGWSLPWTRDTTLADDQAWHALLDGAGVVVDGILGTGVRGAPRQRQAEAIRRANAAAPPVLALDVPSGVDAGTGAVPGAAVSARVTVCFGAPKMGTLLHPGRAHSGRVVAVEIGFPPLGDAVASAQVVTPAWVGERLPVRGPDTHKNAVGRVLVVAGKAGMGGAAVLAARGALRAGAGLVQVCSPGENRTVLQRAVPEAIYVDPDDGASLEDALAQATVVAVGPGMGTTSDAEGVLARVLAIPGPALVVDADALNLLAQGRPASVVEAVRGRAALLTPHPGEMGRLLPGVSVASGGDRVAAVRQAAEAFGCAVLLKGAPSLVAGPGSPVLLDSQGTSDLAVAGMGDVLSGVCAGVLAQGCAPLEGGAVSLHLTGRAASLAGRGAALIPTDVVRWLPESLAQRGPGVSDLALPFVLFDLDPAR